MTDLSQNEVIIDLHGRYAWRNLHNKLQTTHVCHTVRVLVLKISVPCITISSIWGRTSMVSADSEMCWNVEVLSLQEKNEHKHL